MRRRPCRWSRADSPARAAERPLTQRIRVDGTSTPAAVDGAPQRVHITGAEGSLARRVLALLAGDRDVVDGSADAPSDVVIAPRARGPRPSGAAARERHRRRAAEMLDDADRRCAEPPRAGVVGDGLRRLRQQPDPADRGRRPAPRRRLRVRPPAGDRRGDGRRAGGATSPARTVAVLRPVVADGRRRHVVAGRARWPPGSASASARTTRRPSSCTSTTWRRRSCWPSTRRLDGVFNVAPDGWVAGERVRALTGGRPAHPAARSARRRRRRRCGGASSAARSRRGCAATPASRGSSPTTGCKAPGLGADGHERAGVRRGHRGPVVDDDHAEAASGADARGDGRADGRGDRRRRQFGPGVAAASTVVTVDDGSAPSRSPSARCVVGGVGATVDGGALVGGRGRRHRRWRGRRRHGRRRGAVVVVVVDAPGIVDTVSTCTTSVDRRSCRARRGRRRRRRPASPSATIDRRQRHHRDRSAVGCAVDGRPCRRAPGCDVASR